MKCRTANKILKKNRPADWAIEIAEIMGYPIKIKRWYPDYTEARLQEARERLARAKRNWYKNRKNYPCNVSG